MATANIKIQDVEVEGNAKIDVSYDFVSDTGENENSIAALYGYTVHYLFKTKKIEEFVPEALADFNSTNGITG